MSSEQIEQIAQLLHGSAADSTIAKRIPMLVSIGNALDSKNLDWITHPSRVKSLLDDKPIGTRCTYLAAVISLGKAMHLDSKLLHVYEKLSDEWNRQRNVARLNNQATERHESYLSIGLDGLRERLSDYTPKTLNDLQKSTIVACYLLQPALRNDYGELVITTKLTGLDDIKNYYYRKGRVIKIILNKYKTAGRYGKQVIKIEDSNLIDRLIDWTTRARDYAISKKQSPPSYLFYYRISKAGLTRLSPISLQAGLPTMSEEVIGLPMGINDYRKLWENAIQHDPKYQKLSNAEQEKLHMKLLHSGSAARLDYKKV